MADELTRTSRVWTVPNLLSMVRLAGRPGLPLAGARPRGRRLGARPADGLRGHRLPRRLPRPQAQPDVRPGADPRPGRRPALHPGRGDRARRCATSSRGGWPSSCRCATCCSGAWCRCCARAATARCPVHFLGKAATFNLLYAFPLLLLGDGEGVVATLAEVFGWAFAIWGIGLYWWAGVLYAWQVRKLLRTTERCAQRRARSVP